MSILKPVLCLFAVEMPVCICGAYLLRDYCLIRNLLIILAALPVLCSCAVLVGYAVNKPEMLMSFTRSLKKS